MSNESPKDAQKGGQGAIGKRSGQDDAASGAGQPQDPPQEKKTGYDKDQRPGQKP